MKVDIESKRSDKDIYSAIFEEYGVAGFFENYPIRFPADELKDITLSLLANGKGKKADLKTQIIDYVNYEYTPRRIGLIDGLHKPITRQRQNRPNVSARPVVQRRFWTHASPRAIPSSPTR